MTTKEIAKAIDNLTKDEVIELINELTETYGYKAPEPIIIEKDLTSVISEEKSTFTVLLQAIGGQKLSVVKAYKNISGLTLMESKATIESTIPVKLKENVSKEEAESIKNELEALGAKILIV